MVFKDWLHKVSLLDEEITADLKCIADFTSKHIAKRQHIDNSSLPPKYNTYSQQQTHPSTSLNPPVTGAISITTNQSVFNYFHCTSCNTNSQHSSKCTWCPKLLPSKYDLLEKHSGCQKCCHFYVNHQVPDCPNDLPNPNTYSTLTKIWPCKQWHLLQLLLLIVPTPPLLPPLINPSCLQLHLSKKFPTKLSTASSSTPLSETRRVRKNNDKYV